MAVKSNVFLSKIAFFLCVSIVKLNTVVESYVFQKLQCFQAIEPVKQKGGTKLGNRHIFSNF